MSTAKYVNSSSIAEMLGISKRKVDMMAAGKEIPFIKIGRIRRYDPDRVTRVLEAQQQSSNTNPHNV